MNIIIEKKSIIRLLSRVDSVCPKKTTLPILSYALLTAEKEAGRVVCSATDLALAVTAVAPSAVIAGGSIAIPSKEVLERVKVMPDSDIILKTDDATSTLIINAKGSKREFRIKYLPGSDFPTLPQSPKTSTKVSISANLLSSLIDRVAFAMSVDDTRPHLNSMLLESTGEVLRAVTTDGHRLSKVEVPFTDAKFTCLVSLRGTTELRKFCDNVTILDLHISASHMSAVSEDVNLSVKLVDASFPPYNQVIPASSKHRIVANKMLFIDCIRAVSVANESRSGMLTMTISNGKFELSTRNESTSQATDEFAIDYAGETLSFGSNGQYMIQALSAVEDADIEIGLSGELDPIILQGMSDKTTLEVVMPMRI